MSWARPLLKRELTYVGLAPTGYIVPQYAPGAAFRYVEVAVTFFAAPTAHPNKESFDLSVIFNWFMCPVCTTAKNNAVLQRTPERAAN